MNKIAILHTLFACCIIAALAACSGNNSSATDNDGDGNMATNALPPRPTIDRFIKEMVEIHNMIISLDRNDPLGERTVEKRFDRACSEAIEHFERMTDDERTEAYDYWVSVTKSPEIRALCSFDLDTPTGQKFAEYIDSMRITHFENMTRLIGRTLRFTDKAGTQFTLCLKDTADGQYDGDCVLISAKDGSKLPGRWTIQSKDLGMTSIRINIPGTGSYFTPKDNGVNFGDAHHYHCSHYEFFPDTSSGKFYIVKGKIWPYFISTDGFNEYEQFALTYTIQAD